MVAYITFLSSHIGVNQTVQALHEKALYTPVTQNTTLNDGAFKVSTQVSGSTDCRENKKMSRQITELDKINVCTRLYLKKIN